MKQPSLSAKGRERVWLMRLLVSMRSHLSLVPFKRTINITVFSCVNTSQTYYLGSHWVGL